MSKEILAILADYPKIHNVWIAYSGGLDSTVLLHQAANLNIKNLLIKAIHVNHGLSSNAGSWANHCQEYAESLGVNITVKRISQIPDDGVNVENWARELRYAIFSELLHDNSYAILMAHHQDDQAETFLLQALRGSGVLGLSAMPKARKLANGVLLRPLLQRSKSDLNKYAIEHSLKWIEDESNDSIDFNRNYLRHKIIPFLENRWPSLKQNLSRCSINCADSNLLLEEYLDQELTSLINPLNNKQLDYSILGEYAYIKQAALLRSWVRKNNFATISRIQLEQIISSLAKAETGWQFTWSKHILRLYKKQLYLSEFDVIKQGAFEYKWNGKQDLFIENYDYTINKEKLIKLGLNVDKINWQEVTVRNRKPNDITTRIGRKKANKLKILFQELDIASWQRQSASIILEKNKIIAVYPFFVSNTHLAIPKS